MSAQLGFLVPGHPGTPQIRRDLQIRRDPGKQRAGREIHEFRRQPPTEIETPTTARTTHAVGSVYSEL